MQAITFLDTKLVEPMVEHEIRLRAYEIYESRGKVEGHALEDWLQAQADVRRRSHGFYNKVPEAVVLENVIGGEESKERLRNHQL
jgi:hypothetical protein